MNDNLTTNASNEAESPAFLVGAVSGSYWVKDSEYSKCCDYPTIMIADKKRVEIKHCSQCLSVLK